MDRYNSLTTWWLCRNEGCVWCEVYLLHVLVNLYHTVYTSQQRFVAGPVSAKKHMPWTWMSNTYLKKFNNKIDFSNDNSKPIILFLDFMVQVWLKIPYSLLFILQLIWGTLYPSWIFLLETKRNMLVLKCLKFCLCSKYSWLLRHRKANGYDQLRFKAWTTWGVLNWSSSTVKRKKLKGYW